MLKRLKFIPTLVFLFVFCSSQHPLPEKSNVAAIGSKTSSATVDKQNQQNRTRHSTKQTFQPKQKPENNRKNDWEIDNLNTAQNASYLTDTEKAVILEMNKVRTAPAKYAELYLTELKKYYRGDLLQYPGEIAIITQERVTAVNECYRFLQHAKPVGLLRPSHGMSRAAADLVKDQSESDGIGHQGGDRSNSGDRLNRYGKWDKICGENIDYGNQIARRIVLSLLIDDGVSSRGHRTNIFKKDFHLCGVAVGTHPTYRFMCVITYAGSYRER